LESARFKYSEEAEVSEEKTKKMRMMNMMMERRRWRDNFKPDTREMNGAGS
jgi:hypothetical protein